MHLNCIAEAAFVFGASYDIYLRSHMFVMEVDVYIGIQGIL